MPVQVTVNQGTIEGEKRTTFCGKTYYSFEGVPYARPPIGKLRFRDPQPPESWTGVRDCTRPGNKCAQINPFSKKGFEGSEDCLYLNVYTPSLPAVKLQKLPVLYFVHGGRLTFGYGDYYKPDYIVKHDVILVTLNYRLNILGFLSLDTHLVPGNAGLKDCVAALRWVKSNIGVFNGDSNNITVSGESAGAAIVTAFLTSKMAVGLYQKLISQSGNVLADVFMCNQDHIAEAGRVAQKLGAKIAQKEELYGFLQNVAVEDLVKAYSSTKSHRLLNPVLMAVVEKKFPGVERFIHEPPIVSFINNNFANVPTIVGSNSYEGGAFVNKGKNGIKYQKDFRKYVPHYMYLEETDPKCMKIAKQIKKYYFQDREVDDDTKIEYIRLLSDAFFNRDTTNFTEFIAKNNENNCYSYKFKYVGSLNIGIMKELGVHATTHGDSIQYQFYRKNQELKTTERDRVIIDFFSETWTNFVKYGKPTWSNQTLEWQPYTPKEKLTLVINDEMKMVKNEDWHSFQFWRSVCGERSKL